MGTSLFNTTPAATYPALIKVGDNTSIDGTLKTLSDGAGNDLPIQVSSTVTNFTGNVGIGTTAPVAKLQVNGVTALSNADLTGYNLYSPFNIVRNGATSMAMDRYTGAPHFNFRAAGGTIASPSTQVGELGKIDFWSYSGTSFNQNVRLIAQAENFVGGLAQTQRLSIGMGQTGTALDYYYEMVNGNSYFGASAFGTTPTARVQIIGSGSTSATTSLLVQNSAGTTLMSVKDDLSTNVKTLYIDNSIEGSNAGRMSIISQYDLAIRPNQGGISVAEGYGFNVNNSALIEMQSTTKGFLPPRMTTIQRDAIATPATGLKIYNTTLNTTDTYDGANWQRFGQQTLIKGGGSTSATTSLLVVNSLGNTSMIVRDDGNVGIGTTNPFALLTVGGQSSFYSVQSAGTGSDFFYSDINPNLTAGANNQVVSLVRLRDRGQANTGGFTGTQRLSLIMENVAGGQFPFQLFSESGALRIGHSSVATPTALVQVKGTGSTSATIPLLIENSSGTQTFKVEDGGVVQIGLTSFITWTFSSNTLSSSQFAFINSSNGSILTSGGASGGVFGNNDGGKVADSGISVAQVASAVLEVSSTTKGFLPPRMTTAERVAISSPANGLIVFDTDVQNLCYRRDSTWVQVSFTAV